MGSEPNFKRCNCLFIVLSPMRPPYMKIPSSGKRLFDDGVSCLTKGPSYLTLGF